MQGNCVKCHPRKPEDLSQKRSQYHLRERVGPTLKQHRSLTTLDVGGLIHPLTRVVLTSLGQLRSLSIASSVV